MKESAKLEKLLKKYKLTSRLSYFAKRRILKSKRKTFARILKMESYDSGFVSAAVYFEYLLGRFGINISPAGGARIFAAASVFSLFVIISSSVLLFYNYRDISKIYVAKTEIHEYQKGHILFADNGVKIIRNNEEISGIKAKERLLTKDEIITGDKGTLLFQMEKKTLVRVLAKSRSSVNIDLKLKAIKLDAGTVFCNVRELAPDEQFSVATPNAMIVVVGTKFSVKYRKRKTTVMVIEGTVKATNLTSNKVIHVGQGKTAVIYEDSSILKDSEKSEEMPLKKFSRLEYMSNIMDRSDSDMDELRDKIYEPESDSKEVKKKSPEEKIRTLEDLKRKYGRLEELQLYNGRKYTGAIISRGVRFTVVTLKGVIKIPAKKVKNVRIIK